jgi:hypothetical protein
VAEHELTATEVRKLLLDIGEELGCGPWLLQRAQVKEPRLRQVVALKRAAELDEVLHTPGPRRACDTERSPPPDDEPTDPAA